MFSRDCFASADAHQSFERVYHDCRRSMLGYALRLVDGDQDLADDVVQDAFIRIARNLSMIAALDEAAIRLYAMKAVRSAAWDLMRTRQHFPVLDRDEDEMPETSTGADPVLDALCTQEDQHRIALCIRQLPVKYREVFYLYFVHDMTLREIAQWLRLPASTVRKRFSRGKHLLAQELKKGGMLHEKTE